MHSLALIGLVVLTAILLTLPDSARAASVTLGTSRGRQRYGDPHGLGHR
jgi:hypothetical protein